MCDQQIKGTTWLWIIQPSIVVEYVPQLKASFRKSYKRCVDRSWKMDETFVKVNGKWTYLYRALDESGQTVDFLFSEKRDSQAARRFLQQGIILNGLPKKINLNNSTANKAGIDRINEGLNVNRIHSRQIKC